MTEKKRIKTYEDLEEEKLRLTGLLRTQEELIKTDIAGVKHGLNPFGKAAGVVHNLFTREKKDPLLNLGLEMSIDLVLRRFLLARAGWLTRVVVPFFVKNYSSHFIDENKKNVLVNKVNGFFQRLRSKKNKLPRSYTEVLAAEYQASLQSPE